MNEEQRFEQMRKLTQTEAEQHATIQAITQATTKPMKNWAVSFIGTVSLIAICLLTFYLVTIDPSEPITSSPGDHSIEKVYYFTNGNRDEDTFFEKWSPFYLHVGVVNDQIVLKQFSTFLQTTIPKSKEEYYNGWSGNHYIATDILIMYENGSERRIKELSTSTFLDMNSGELFYIPSDSWFDFSREFLKNPNSNLGSVLGLLLLFFLPFTVSIWFKRKYPVIKHREWSLNWTHHFFNYFAIAFIWGFYSFWESKFGTFHIAAYAALWLLYGTCQVAYRLKKHEHPRSIQLTIINHLIGTIALVLCLYGF